MVPPGSFVSIVPDGSSALAPITLGSLSDAPDSTGLEELDA
jgi:hypothetical protein